MQAIFREFQTGENRYQDDPVHTYRNNPAYKINQRILASVVGAIAVLLPFVLMAGFAFSTPASTSRSATSTIRGFSAMSSWFHWQ